MIYITKKTDLSKASEIREYFKANEIKDEKHPYDYFDTDYEGVHIHCNKNKKDVYTFTFSSSDEKAKEVANIFFTDYTVKEYIKEEKTDIKEGFEDLSYQIGSDEVGKGDFFGPLIVVASYVTRDDIPLIEKLKINDSKKMNDDYIFDIGPTLIKKIKNHILIVSPKKLSSLHTNGFNIDKVLAISHNFVQKKVIEKYSISDHVITYIDQFMPEEGYRKYVSDDIISNPLYFRTRAETFYPSVAVSSVIARYTFLKEWKDMEKKFKMEIPKGASTYVDKVYGRLKNIYGEEVLKNYIKTFFSNYKKEN